MMLGLNLKELVMENLINALETCTERQLELVVALVKTMQAKNELNVNSEISICHSFHYIPGKESDFCQCHYLNPQ
jgi:hypothetical protein